MESAIAAVDLGRYRRIVQMFWDPEPTNDRERNVPVWCLGSSYVLNKGLPRKDATAATPKDDGAETPPSQDYVKPDVPANGLTAAPDTPPDSASSSFDSSLAYDASASEDGGWPPAFLEDFESKIWMTYRSEFASIPRSTDPRSVLALSFSMRIKSQLLVDQNGFSSDSGWGCMIRSGQSLLANAMLMYRLGRGTF
jgi:cysteine protease ATG4